MENVLKLFTVSIFPTGGSNRFRRKKENEFFVVQFLRFSHPRQMEDSHSLIFTPHSLARALTQSTVTICSLYAYNLQTQDLLLEQECKIKEMSIVLGNHRETAANIHRGASECNDSQSRPNTAEYGKENQEHHHQLHHHHQQQLHSSQRHGQGQSQACRSDSSLSKKHNGKFKHKKKKKQPLHQQQSPQNIMNNNPSTPQQPQQNHIPHQHHNQHPPKENMLHQRQQKFHNSHIRNNQSQHRQKYNFPPRGSHQPTANRVAAHNPSNMFFDLTHVPKVQYPFSNVRYSIAMDMGLELELRMIYRQTDSILSDEACRHVYGR